MLTQSEPVLEHRHGGTFLGDSSFHPPLALFHPCQWVNMYDAGLVRLVAL